MEQLLINSANEQMQYHYIQRVFAWEQLEQAEEELPMTSLSYYDNKIAVDQLLGKPTGILTLIDEASRTGHTTHHVLGNKIASTDRRTNRPSFRRYREIGEQHVPRSMRA